jgi:hypothetical protein
MPQVNRNQMPTIRISTVEEFRAALARLRTVEISNPDTWAVLERGALEIAIARFLAITETRH